MSRELAISLLRSGNTGDQIIQILDTIAADYVSDSAEPTLGEIQF